MAGMGVWRAGRSVDDGCFFAKNGCTLIVTGAAWAGGPGLGDAATECDLPLDRRVETCPERSSWLSMLFYSIHSSSHKTEEKRKVILLISQQKTPHKVNAKKKKKPQALL